MIPQFEPPLSREAGAAMTALVDCTVVRARLSHRGLSELAGIGIAILAPIRDRPGFADWRLAGPFTDMIVRAA